MTSADTLLIGAHTSAAGGLHNALLEGQSIGATTIQLFTANQRQWRAKVLDEDAIDRFKATLKETGLKKIMSHDSYLINLGSPDEENLAKSRNAFRQEVDRCVALGITYLNFHPGAAVGRSDEECLDGIIESLLEATPSLENSDLTLLLESTAGQGSTMGFRFEHLRYIIDGVKKSLPIGVCIDTCHAFAAGYDLRTAEGCDHTLKEFDAIVGLPYLHAFHFNDSIHPLNSRKDRHAPLGEGEIGIEAFRFFVNDPRTRKLPKYLETPGGPEAWVKEIALLRKLASER